MSTRVFLVRHGSTALAAEDRFAGTIEVLLSDLGREQVRRLSRRLAPIDFAAAYASPLGRTMETACILAQPHGLPVIQRDGLREISHGHWEGMTRAEVERKYREEYAHWERDPYTFAPAGGETGLAVTTRAMPALLEIVAALSMSGSSAVVAINALMLKRTKLAGIRQPGKTAAPGAPDAAATPEPAKASAVPANPQPDKKVAA